MSREKSKVDDQSTEIVCLNNKCDALGEELLLSNEQKKRLEELLEISKNEYEREVDDMLEMKSQYNALKCKM